MLEWVGVEENVLLLSNTFALLAQFQETSLKQELRDWYHECWRSSRFLAKCSMIAFNNKRVRVIELLFGS